MKLLGKIFLTFLKIGLFTFGGGYSMISLIEQECHIKNNWISKEDFKEIIIISESTPGPISINCATFIGYKLKKILGAIIATIALILPSLVIITLLSIFLSYLKDNLYLNIIFNSLRAAVILLMIKAFFNLSSGTTKNFIFYFLLILAFSLNFFFQVKAIFLILAAFTLSIIYFLFKRSKKEAN